MNFLPTLLTVVFCFSSLVRADVIPPPATETENLSTCVVIAKPSQLKLGESLTLTVIATGENAAVTLDGTPISYPLGQRLFTPTTAGSYVANVAVKGPSGVTTCTAQYQVAVNGCKKGGYVLKTYSEPVIKYKKRQYYEFRCEDGK